MLQFYLWPKLNYRYVTFPIKKFNLHFFLLYFNLNVVENEILSQVINVQHVECSICDPSFLSTQYARIAFMHGMLGSNFKPVKCDDN